MTRIAIDPVTRIEGHLRIEVEVEGGTVRDAWSSGTMFRGLELILRDRDPRDAWVFAQRACGVCTTVHALASVRAAENALGITVPPNARRVRNLMAAVQYPEWAQLGRGLGNYLTYGDYPEGEPAGSCHSVSGTAYDTGPVLGSGSRRCNRGSGDAAAVASSS